MIPIKVTVDYNIKLSKAELAIISLPNRLKDLRPLMQKAIAPAFDAMERKHWESRGAAFGHKWAPLAPSTIASKRSKGTLSKGILQDSDNLFRAVFRARASDNRLRVVDGRVRFQANVGTRYAIFHQVGTQFMPDRQVIPDPLPLSFKATIRNIVKEYIRSGKINAR